jgi:succinate dehydrogenase/fumarate reductase cytochrome b subunit
MAELLSELQVRISANASELNSAMKDAETKTEQASKNMANSIKQIGVAMTVAGAAITAAMGFAVKSAMNAVESENLFTVSLGKNAEAARKWSEELSGSLGLNAYELRKNIGVLDVMVQSMGLSEQAAYDMSKGVVELANDMASFYNLPVEEAFDKIKSGLVGMPRPLQDIGIVINETAAQVYALKVGMIKEGEEMTNQQKIMARYGALLEQTTMAQGDLARTIDTPVNKLRVLGAQFDQLKIQIGEGLLPIVAELLTRVSGALKGITEWIKVNPELTATIVKVVAATGIFLTVAGGLLLIIPKLVAGWQLLNLAFTASPIGLIIVAVAALIAIGVLLWKNWDKVSHFFVDAWSYMKEGAFRAADAILAVVQAVLGWIPGFGSAIKSARESLASLIESEQDHRKTMDSLAEPIKSYTTALEDMVARNKSATDSQEDLTTSFKDTTTSAKETNQQLIDLQETINNNTEAEKEYKDALKESMFLEQERARNKQQSIDAGLASMFGLDKNYSVAADASLQRFRDWISTPEGYAEYGAAMTKVNSYDSGGIVPGALGQPQLAMVHGGEQILTPSQRGGDTYIVQGSVLVQREIGEVALKYGRNSKRKDYTTGL